MATINLQKEIKTLERLIKDITDKQSRHKSKIKPRQDNFDKRSENWQDTDKGIYYYRETQALQKMVDSIEFELYTLNTVLDNLKQLN